MPYSLQLQNIRNVYNIQIRFFKIDQFFMKMLISNEVYGMKKAIVDNTKHSPNLVHCLLQRSKACN